MKIILPVTREQLDASIETHRNALIGYIRDGGRSYPPADGLIGKIGNSLSVLLSVVPEDEANADPGMIDVGEMEHSGEPVRVRGRRRLRTEE